MSLQPEILIVNSSRQVDKSSFKVKKLTQVAKVFRLVETQKGEARRCIQRIQQLIYCFLG
jgi:hypothetical protein